MTVADPWQFDFDQEALMKKYREERDRRLRKDHQAQYITIGDGKGAKYAEWLTDLWSPHVEREPLTVDTSIVILGAGFSGIQMGAQLTMRGVTDFKIIDRAGDFGGTWYWNRYPGVACDSEGWYSLTAYCYLPLLEETGYMPSHKYAGGPEIRQHCARMGKHFGLYEHAIFNTAVTEFRWDDSDKVWRGTTDRGDKISTKFLVTCGGPITHPHLPDVPGIDTFQGKEFHTARWDYEYTGGHPDGDFDMKGLNDKTVAIIGTGATAIQCVPYVGASAKKLFVLQRTPSAVDIRDNHPTDPTWWKSLPKGWQAKRDWNFQHGAMGPLAGKPEIELDDGFSRSIRGWWSLVANSLETGAGKQYTMQEQLQFGDFQWMNRIRQRCEGVVKDKKTAEALKPWYNLFCKRPVYSDTYLQTFNRSNVELVDTSVTKGIEKITPTGIVVGGKEYEVDCIIWASGYTVGAGETHHDYQIFGRDGAKWYQKMETHGGYATLFGVATSSFPNYLQFGNSQAAVSVNFPSIYNDQAQFCAYVLSEALKRGVKTFECTRKAEEEWTEEVLSKQRVRGVEFQENCTPAAWMGFMRSEGYYNAEGDIKKMKQLVRTQAYQAGALAYRMKLQEYMASGKLEGFEIVAA